MNVVKILPKTLIIEINSEQFEVLMKKLESHSFDCNDKRLFILTNNNGFTAVDNTSGDLFTESFKTRTGAYIWLCGLQEAEPIQAIEDNESWY